MIKIKRKQSTLAEGTTSISDAVLASVSVGEGSRKKFTLMSEDYITLKFSLAEDVCFQVGDYVDEDITGYYFITEPSLPTYNTETEGYDYSQEMKAYYMLWQNHFMRYSPKTSGSEVSWSLTTTIETHAQVFVDNVNAIDSYKGAKYTFVIDKTNVKEGSVLISYNATGMIDALNMIAQAFECEWWIIGSVIYFGRCENGTEMDFDLSKNCTNMKASKSSDSFANRIVAFGGTRNITPRYRKKLEFTITDVISYGGKSYAYDSERPLMGTFFPKNERSMDMATISSETYDSVYTKDLGEISQTVSFAAFGMGFKTIFDLSKMGIVISLKDSAGNDADMSSSSYSLVAEVGYKSGDTFIPIGSSAAMTGKMSNDKVYPGVVTGKSSVSSAETCYVRIKVKPSIKSESAISKLRISWSGSITSAYANMFKVFSNVVDLGEGTGEFSVYRTCDSFLKTDIGIPSSGGTMDFSDLKVTAKTTDASGTEMAVNMESYETVASLCGLKSTVDGNVQALSEEVISKCSLTGLIGKEGKTGLGNFDVTADALKSYTSVWLELHVYPYYTHTVPTTFSVKYEGTVKFVPDPAHITTTMASAGSTSAVEIVKFQEKLMIVNGAALSSGTVLTFPTIIAGRVPASYFKSANSQDVISDGIVSSRLMLPDEDGKRFIQSDTTLLESQIVEKVLTYDKIFPKMKYTVSEVTSTVKHKIVDNLETSETYTEYTIVCAGLEFSEEYIIGDSLEVIFQTGKLAGLSYKSKYNSSEDPTIGAPSNSFTVIFDSDSSLPNTKLRPEVGNEVIISGVDTSFFDVTGQKSVVVKAEEELYAQTVKDAEKILINNGTFECTMKSERMVADENFPYVIGQKVSLVNRTFFKSGKRSSRIIGFEFDLAQPCDNPIYTVGESIQYTRIGELESKVDTIQYNGMSYYLSGSTGSGGSVYVLKKNETTEMTDSNVFSSLRTVKEIENRSVSKVRDEIVRTVITYLKSQEFRGGATFGEFVSGSKGASVDSGGNIEAESVTARSFIRAVEYYLNRIRVQGSTSIFTESGTIEFVSSVESTTDKLFELRIKKEDSSDIIEFVEGDIVKGIVNNLSRTLASGSDVEAYYTSFMKVISVDTADNTMVVSMYGDEDVPAGKNYPPCVYMNLRRWGNADTDNHSDRQSCWYISSDEGRIMFLRGVTQPKLIDTEGGSNYAGFLGIPPKGLKAYGNQQIDYTNPYLYVKGVICQDLVYVNYIGVPIRHRVDRGEWDVTIASDANNYYRFDTSTQDTVTRNGVRYGCMSSKTTEVPSRTSTAWQYIEGMENVGAWKPKTQFYVNQIVSFNYGSFLCNTACYDIPPMTCSTDSSGNPYTETDANGKTIYLTTGNYNSQWTVLVEPQSIVQLTVEAYMASTEEPSVFPVISTDRKSLSDMKGWALNQGNAVVDSTHLYVWRIRSVMTNGYYAAWEPPFRISGKNGSDGEDGAGIEFVYKLSGLTATSPSLSEDDWTDSGGKTHTKAEDDFVPSGWTDNPTGIDETNQIEWYSSRTKKDGVWSPFCKVSRWAYYGHDGTDGDGVEYIFRLSDTDAAPELVQADSATDQFQETGDYSGKEYIPEGWTDNPTGITDKNRYEWVSKRKRTGEKWGVFGTPTKWSYLSVNSAEVQLDDYVIAVDTDYEGAASADFSETVNAVLMHDGVKCTITSSSIQKNTGSKCSDITVDDDKLGSHVTVSAAAASSVGSENIIITLTGKHESTTVKASGILKIIPNKTGKKGDSNYRIDLDNEVSMVNCEEDGTVTDETNGYETSTYTIYDGYSPVTNISYNWTIEITPYGISCNTSGTTITPYKITEDDARIIVKATKKTNTNIFMTAIYTIKKNKKGQKGTDAVKYSLHPSASQIVIDPDTSARSVSAITIDITKTVGKTASQMSALETGQTVNVTIDGGTPKVYTATGTGAIALRTSSQAGTSIDVSNAAKSVFIELFDSSGNYLDHESVDVVKNGASGEGVEHAYILKDTNPGLYPTDAASISSSEYQADGYLPYTSSEKTERYTAVPTGTDINHLHEWETVRKKINGVWGPFTTPSSYSTYGVDGATREYIYYRNNSSTFDGTDPSTLDASQQPQYKPESLSAWTLDSAGVDEDHKFEWESHRTRENEVWGKYTTPKISSSYGSSGAIPYPDGEYSNTKTYVNNGIVTPIVYLPSADKYYLLYKKSSITGISPTDSSKYWKELTSSAYIFSKILFSSFAKLGSAIFKDDYMISQKGMLNGAESNDYTKFNINDPDGSTDPANDFIPNIMMNFLTGMFRSVSGIFKNATVEGQLTASKGFSYGVTTITAASDTLTSSDTFVLLLGTIGVSVTDVYLPASPNVGQTIRVKNMNIAFNETVIHGNGHDFSYNTEGNDELLTIHYRHTLVLTFNGQYWFYDDISNTGVTYTNGLVNLERVVNRVQGITSDYYMTKSDYYIYCTNTNAEINVYLPSSPEEGRTIYIVREGMKVTVNGNGHNISRGSSSGTTDNINNQGEIDMYVYAGSGWRAGWLNV